MQLQPTKHCLAFAYRPSAIVAFAAASLASCNSPGIDGTSNIFLDEDDPRAVITHIEWINLKSSTVQVSVRIGDTLSLDASPKNKDGFPVASNIRQTVSDTAVLRPVPNGICEDQYCRYVGSRVGSARVTAQTTSGRTLTGEPVLKTLLVVVSTR